MNLLNYLLADPHQFAVVEAHPNRVRVRAAQGEWMDTTNHYRHPEMVPLMGRRAMTGSRRRAARMADLLRAVPGHEGWAETQSILRDHVAPLCDHRPENATLWSVIADLSERRVEYARGQPCCTDYELVEWPGPKVAQASPWYTPA